MNELHTLSLSLLGGFHLRYREETMEIRAARMQALLAYLALHSQTAVSRQRLAFLFWPDSREGQAKTNLRQLLHRLRQLFPPIEDYIDFEHALQWRDDAPAYIDVRAFQAALAEAGEAAAARRIGRERAALERAARLYGGPLLPECYDAWIEPERASLQQAHARALQRLTALLEQQGDYRAALVQAQRLLALDEFDEAAHRLLMHLHALNGDRAGALRAYNRCAAILQEELGVQPQAATRELRERLLRLPERPPPPPPNARRRDSAGGARRGVGRHARSLAKSQRGGQSYAGHQRGSGRGQDPIGRGAAHLGRAAGLCDRAGRVL